MNPTHSDWCGRTLQTTLQEQPALQLSFYSFGVILRKVTDNGGVIEHPVDPQAISRAHNTTSHSKRTPTKY